VSHKADEAYMGYAGRDELIAFLNELLEAERAGARVTLESAAAAGSGAIAELVRKLREMLARVRDNQLHADPTEMLRSHEADIALATEVVGRARERPF
jgi:hypothetical protein